MRKHIKHMINIIIVSKVRSKSTSTLICLAESPPEPLELSMFSMRCAEGRAALQSALY
jgi:hypothetical protein